MTVNSDENNAINQRELIDVTLDVAELQLPAFLGNMTRNTFCCCSGCHRLPIPSKL